MAFEDIDNLAPPKAAAIPPAGVRVSSRGLNIKRGGVDRGAVRFIRIFIGAQLARGLGLTSDLVMLRLSFGSDADAGKIMIAAPAGGGDFPARRDKGGSYALTINATTADGLFALDFPAFVVEKLTVAPPTMPKDGSPGLPPRAIFAASAAMLAVDD